MKKVLFLTYDFPYPFNSGGKIRAFNLLKYAREGFDLQLFSFSRGDISARSMRKLHDIGITKIYTQKRTSAGIQSKVRSIFSSKNSIFKTLYYLPEVENKLITIIEKEGIDVVHCESFYTSFYITDRVELTGVKTVFGTENIEFKIYEDFVARSVNHVLRPIYKKEVGKIKNEELSLLKKADVAIAVSQDEADFFESEVHERCFVIENGIDLDYFSYQPKKKTGNFNILFVGNFKYFPNVEAAKFLYEKVYGPLKGEVRLTVVGNGVEKLSIRPERGVQLIDYVEDIREVYKTADVMVSPVTMGGGTSFKTLEAMAMGVPVIAREVRMKPLGVFPDKHYFAAETPADFLEKIEFVQENPKNINILTSTARNYVEKNYSWDVIGTKLQKIWKGL